MFFNTIIALIFCICAVNINALHKCTGPAHDSHDDFKVKYDAAPIVAYGSVIDIRNTAVTFKVNCTLKGDLHASTIELSQFSDVTNFTECHYLTANKNYIVFLESMKTAGPDGKILFRLADMEEIDINSNTLTNFLTNECDDEDDHGNEMTMFFAHNNHKCGEFTATCNKMTKTALSALNYPPLTKDTTFLGGYSKSLPIPKPNSNGDETISGKSNGGISDEIYRGSATVTNIWMPIIIFMFGLTMIFKN